MNPTNMKGKRGFQKGHKINLGNNWNVGKKLSVETRAKLSQALLGNKYAVGAVRSPEHRLALSVAHKGNKYAVPKFGADNPSWKGGITPVNKKIRKSLEYKLWRIAVFQRDDFTCVFCRVRSKKARRIELHADHIKPFSLCPALRFETTNGRTLCVDCHRNTDTFAGRIQNYATSKDSSV